MKGQSVFMGERIDNIDNDAKKTVSILQRKEEKDENLGSY